MIAFDEAVAIVLDVARPLEAERVAIGEADGRVLAEAVIARVAAPPADVSAMDGYAVREADLGALPARLRVVGESFAGGGYDTEVEPGSCVRIFTGAPVPAGTDRIVIQETVEREGDFAVIAADPGPARHIRKRGSDFGEGDRLVDVGRRLGYRELVAAAGGDHADLPVWRRPKLYILSTGDELAPPGSARRTPGAIPESVSFGVAALSKAWGGETIGKARLGDSLPQMERAAAAAVAAADLVVVTGGASVGDRDFAKPMFAPLGLELLFAKVAIKPGKPVWLGRVGRKLVMGLPGNPTSALVTARLLLAPLVAGLAGLDPRSALAWRSLELAAPLDASGPRETFVRARWGEAGVEPLGNQDSSAQKTLAEADLLLRRRPSAPPAAVGEPVETLAF